MNPRQLYLESQVNSATPTGLIIMLYDGLLRFAEGAVKNLKENTNTSNTEAAEAVTRCNKILTELNVSLDHQVDQEFCSRMSELYAFFISQFNEAVQQKNAQYIEDVIPMITTLRDAWGEAEVKPDDQPNKETRAA
ncbi:MAG: flagellar export chaperone FliS [Verrucomicrobiota bacterium]